MFPEGRLFEFLIAATVALIVVGPKDLPILLRKFGQFMARVRAMAAEFRASFDEMARQSELDELRKEVEAMRQGQLADIAGAPEVNHTFEEISQGMADVGVQLNAPYTYGGPETTIETVASPKARKSKTPVKAPAKAAAAKKTAAPKVTASKAAQTKSVTPKTAAKAKPAPKAAAAKPATVTATATKPVASKPRAHKATVS
jgi:sec-independent protein translocase protein TatB